MNYSLNSENLDTTQNSRLPLIWNIDYRQNGVGVTSFCLLTIGGGAHNPRGRECPFTMSEEPEENFRLFLFSALSAARPHEGRQCDAASTADRALVEKP